MELDVYQYNSESRSALLQLREQMGDEAEELPVAQLQRATAAPTKELNIVEQAAICFMSSFVGALLGMSVAILTSSMNTLNSEDPLGNGHWMIVGGILGLIGSIGVAVLSAHRHRQYIRRVEKLKATALPYSEYLPSELYEVNVHGFHNSDGHIQLLVYRLVENEYIPYLIEDRHFSVTEKDKAVKYAQTLNERKSHFEQEQPTIHYHESVADEIKQLMDKPITAIPAQQQTSLPIGVK